MPGKLTFDALKTRVATGDIDTVIACMVDMQGRLMGKRFHAQYFIDTAWQETHSCSYLLATDLEMVTVQGFASSSWSSGYGDYIMAPDLSTLRLIPWLPATALVICDVLDHEHHVEVPHSPRAMLKKQCQRLEAMGFKAMMATELEFFLFRESYDQMRDKHYRDMTPVSAYNEDYHIFQTSKEENVMRAIRNGLHGAGIPVECSKGEAGAGQAEINVRYCDALQMADIHSLAKNACKEIAWQQDQSVSFLAKWHADATGSSSHVHQSLWTSDGEPAFADSAGKYGMSPLMRHFMAGQLKHASEFTYFLAPYVNSYKRFLEGTFAPTKAIWSKDNRTAGYRLCGAGSSAVRLECRVGGSDINPYLAMAALLAAGIAGIENALELEPEFVGDAYQSTQAQSIPLNLRDATDALQNSSMLKEAMGADVIEHYARAAQWEQEDFARRVTDYEVARGFERA